MVEKRFKQTEVGLIPEDWEMGVFTDLFTFLPTASYSRADLDNHSYTGYIHYGDIHTKIGYHLNTDKMVSGYVSDEKLKSYAHLKQGDLIIADASEDYSGVGKGFEVINKPNFSVISGLHTFLLRETGQHFALGFKGYFHSNPIIKKQYDALATGLKVFSLSKSIFNRIQIPIPPLPEQKAIAEALTHTDEWIESLEKLIDKKRLIKQGAMQQLLTPKKDWKEFEFNKKIWFQEGPGLRNWQFTKLGIKVINVTNLENGYLNLSRTGRFISLDEYQKMYKHFLIDEGDIVVASSGNSYGKVSIVRKQDLPLLMNTSVIRFKPLSDVSYLFLLIFLKSNFFKSQIDLLITGGAQPNFGPAHLNKIKIWLPKDIQQQNHIANILSDMDSEIEALEQKLSKAKQIKQGMMQELLTGRIRLIDGNSKQEKSKFKK